MTNSEQFQKENYPTTRRPVQVDGVHVSNANSEPLAASSSRVSEANDRGNGRSDAALINNNVSNDNISKGASSTPIDRRPGALNPAEVRSKPRIEIVERQGLAISSRQTSAAQEEAKRLANQITGFLGFGDSAAEAAARAAAAGVRIVFRDRFIVGMYDGFILTNVQEQDAEKVVVTETFGDPHIFTSGRFIRKYTFTGFVRTSGVNYLSRDDDLRVPQNVQFRVFYDKYLRVTEQVRAGRFTRIIVDGEIYEGYITTMNRTRDSMNEFFQGFTFTMLGLRQENSRHESAADRILRKFENEKTNTSQYPERVAQAELTDALGELRLYLTEPDALDSERDILTSPTVVVDRDRTIINTGIRLGAIGNPQVLRVESVAPGVNLNYTFSTASDTGRIGSGSPVHRTLATVNGEGQPGRPIDMVIDNYGALYRWALQNQVSSISGANTLPGGEPLPEGAVRTAVPFTIIADGGSSVELIYELIMLNAAQFVVSNITVTALNMASGSNAESTVNFQSVSGREAIFEQKVMYTEDGNNGLVGPGNQINLKIALEVLEPGLGPLDPEVLQAARLVVDDGPITVNPGVGANRRRISSEESKLRARIASSSFSVNTVSNEIELDVLLQLDPINGADLQDPDNNPFRFSSSVGFEIPIRVEVPGFVEKVKNGESSGDLKAVVTGSLKPPAGIQLGRLIHRGWTETRRVRGIGVELGYHEFELTAEQGGKLPPEVLETVREQGILTILFRRQTSIPVEMNGQRSVKVIGSGNERLNVFFQATSPDNPDRSRPSLTLSEENGFGYRFRIYVDITDSTNDLSFANSLPGIGAGLTLVDNSAIQARLGFRNQSVDLGAPSLAKM